MSPVTLVSVRVGRVREHLRPAWDHGHGPTWRSAYQKDDVAGPVRLTTLGLEGDEHASTDVHGGPHMALLAYAASHYPLWRREPGLERAGPGGFAENLTLEGLDEATVCIGDRYASGDAEIEVSQPRGPCSNVARFWDRPDLVQRVTQTARTGWYLRVLREGTLTRGATLERTARPYPAWTVERVFRLYVAKEQADRAALAEIAECAALSPRWRARFASLMA